jgi:hypothetical protein
MKYGRFYLWSEKYPDWEDVGKLVDVINDNGVIITGILNADEFFDGNNDIPLFYLVLPDGNIESFSDKDYWRFNYNEMQLPPNGEG